MQEMFTVELVECIAAALGECTETYEEVRALEHLGVRAVPREVPEQLRKEAGLGWVRCGDVRCRSTSYLS